jgi:hypothetical protein
MQSIDPRKARHLLRELPYEKRLPVGRMMVPKGIHQARIGSLEELEWTIRPMARTLVAMRLENLARWLREDVGDVQLAERVDEICRNGACYVEQSKAVYEALRERIERLRHAADREVPHA